MARYAFKTRNSLKKLQITDFCSDECANAYIRSCKYCRKVEVKKRYCSDTCRQANIKRMSLGKELFPVCEKYLCGLCPFPKRRCWKRHPRITERKGTIVMQYDKVFSSRLKRYLKVEYSGLILLHSEAVGYRYGVSKKSSVQSRFLFVSSASTSSTILKRLQEDTILSRVVSKCYVVSKHFLDLDSIKTFVRNEKKIISRIQTFPRDLSKILESEDYFNHQTQRGHVLFVCKIGDTYHVGLESKDMPRIAMDDRTPREAVSRAYYKLREIVTRTDILSWANDVSKSNICALDVGT